MLGLAAGLGWVATTCALLWLLNERDNRSEAEHRAHRDEVAHAARALLEQARWHEEQVTKLTESHRAEIAALNQARVEEVSNLLQRIQAPEQAAAEHAGRNAIPDPPPLDYEDDDALIAEAQQRMDDFASDLERLR